MKKLLLLPFLALLGSCATATMTDGEFQSLKTRVGAATTIVSSRLAEEWDAPQRAKAIQVITEVKELAVVNNLEQVVAGDVLRSLVVRFGDKLGLSEQNQRDLRDASLLIELAMGRPITFDLGGKLEPRDQELLLAFLDGLLEGLE